MRLYCSAEKCLLRRLSERLKGRRSGERSGAALSHALPMELARLYPVPRVITLSFAVRKPCEMI
jgi:hypothetical protein